MDVMNKYNILLCIFLYSYIFSACHASSENQRHDNPAITGCVEKVADWQISHFTYAEQGNLHDHGIDSWTNATLYLGLSEWSKTASKQTVYYDWLKGIGDKNDWKIPANFTDYPKYSLHHADELCIAQFYLNMYEKYRDEKMLEATRERVDWIMNNPPNKEMGISNKQSWTWCDALFMAPPVYAHLARITGEEKYLCYMDTEFKRTYHYLYDTKEQLFFRDGSYFEKTEQNGEKIFWGRGNGWVAAGLVNLLKLLPENSEYRPFYEELYEQLVARLVRLQSEDGFWRASLLDPESYPAPETSATALIIYALAYGMNQNLLPKDKYLDKMDKAWNALLSVIDDDGKLGYVQPIGADPKKVTREMTAVYGVGAFLLAGTEVFKLKTEN